MTFNIYEKLAGNTNPIAVQSTNLPCPGQHFTKPGLLIDDSGQWRTAGEPRIAEEKPEFFLGDVQASWLAKALAVATEGGKPASSG